MLSSRLNSIALFLSVSCLSCFICFNAALAADPTYWPKWRGPLGNSVSPDGEPPLRWSETENVRFKVPIPGEGLASPIVWGDRVFILTGVPVDNAAYARAKESAEETLKRGEWPPDVKPVKQSFRVLALSAEDGRLIWQRTAREALPHESHYLDSSWANASPVTDGKTLIAHFGSNGTYAYDLDGKLLWSVDLGDMKTRRGFGEGSSPALHGNTLVINWDHEGESFIVALDKRTGKELWRTERPGEVTSWSTPVVVQRGKETQIVVASTGKSRGYDIKTGRELWRLGGMTVNCVPTPLPHGNVVYLTSGYRGNILQAVDLDRAKGDLVDTEAVLWTNKRHTPYVASPVLYDHHLYYAKGLQNIFSSTDPKSGEVHYTKRLPDIRRIYASPLAAAGKVYVFGRDGATVVLQHGKSFQVLQTNKLDHGIDATPAIVGKRLYVRTRRHLYCLEESGGARAASPRAEDRRRD